MQTTLLAPADPWTIEIIVVTGGAYSSGERRSISRDVQRGLLLRLLQGAYVERSAFEAMRAEEQHVVRMRALTATSSVPVVFSHWSAGVLQGLPVLRERLRFLHITVEDEDVRHRQGVKAHFFLLGGEQPVQFGDLRATGVGRTVVDIAGGSDFEEGVMAADAALAAGVPRALLLTAVEVAGSRRASRRIGEVVAFAHPGAESAGESRSRVTMLRLGVEVPELQHRIVLSDGSNAFLDFFFRSVRVGGEFDGEQKFLDPRMAPEGAGRAVIAEKRREDAVRADLRGLARFGWMEAGSPSLLRSILARAGVVGTNPRTDLAAYAAEAVLARPRRRRRSRWRDASSS